MFAPFDTTYAADLEVELELYVAYDADLEVELEIVEPAPAPPAAPAAPAAIVRAVITPVEIARAAIHARRAAATVSLAPDALDDEWFGSFDETKPVGGGEDFEDQPTTTWRRISDWLLRRAA